MTEAVEVEGSPQHHARVEQLHRAYYQAWEQGDADRAVSMWLDSDDISCTYPGIPAVTGRGAVHALVTEGIELTRGAQFLFEDLSIAVAGDLARLTCVENVVMLGSLSLEAVTDLSTSRLSVTSIFRLVAPGWRLWSHHCGPILEQEAGER